MTDYKSLMRMAFEAREKAYTPYSGFKVGAALLTEDGTVFKGCNIENAAYSPTNCAERTAVFKAVSEGYTEFKAIAIVGGKDGTSQFEMCAPCGVCRQVLREFVNPDKFNVVLGRSEDDYSVYTLTELLPFGFSGKDIL